VPGDPAEELTPEEEPDSIFGAPSADQGVFGSAAPAPSADALPPFAQTTDSLFAAPPSGTATWVAAEPTGPPSAVTNAAASPPLADAQAEAVALEIAPTADLAFTAPGSVGPAQSHRDWGTLRAAASGRAVPTGMHSNLFIALVLIPLISYAVLATIAIVILYTRPQPPHPLEAMPDEGDLKGAKRQKPTSVFHQRVDPEELLPDKLRVPLGRTLQLGDLRITPEKVELRHIEIRTPGFRREASPHASLVLHLLLENSSQDLAFAPTDPYFDRRWRGLSDGSKPYTYLELNGRRLFGGPLRWKAGQPPEAREAIEGQEYLLLRPGESTTALVCTDPQAQVEKLLAGYHGRLLWRVHVRRGLVQVGRREVPATAVVGVSFRDTDIVKSGT
jgi:hypothetical protein